MPHRLFKLLLLAVPAAGLLLVASTLSARAAREQVEQGQAWYLRYCSTCHGIGGGGLGEAAHDFPRSHQNCAKCHDRGRIGFPGGAALLSAPAVVGDDTLGGFRTSRQLYDFVSVSMPYLNPGVLSGEQYWAIVAHLARENGATPRVPLGPLTAPFIAPNP